MCKLRLCAVLLSTCFLSVILTTSAKGAAGDVKNCTGPLNISHSDGYVSVDPFLLADPSGTIHLFWAERLIGGPDSNPNVPDSVMYTRWDHDHWSEPIDIFISPPQNFNKKIAGIRGVIDMQGVIHLVWMGPDQTFFYSSAHASEAGSSRGWKTPLLLDNEQTGTQYSVDIAYTPPQTLHILYGRSQNGVNRTIAYIRSVDSGLTWSEPVEIETFLDFERGASNIRLYVDGAEKLYATWTEWDASGTGQGIYFARSLDNGLHWEQPILLAERAENDYERNWTNLAVLGENDLVAFWEGGFRAYPQAQYSHDGGVTWSEPIDTLYWLIADNGFAEFVRDSQGRLHLFIARRIREGYSEKCATYFGCSGDGNAIWHSIWESGPNWQEPKPVDFTFSPVNFISVVITAGNQLTFAWFDYTNLDIDVMRCEIEDAPALELQTLPTVTPSSTSVSTPTATAMPRQPTPSLQFTQLADVASSPRTTQSNTQAMLLSSFVPACALLLLTILISRHRRRS
jgi:hypothetical protein